MLKDKKNRVDIQVSIMTALIVIFSCLFVFGINYQLAYKNMLKSLINRAVNIHDYVEGRMSKGSFSELNTIEDEDSDLYRDIKHELENIRNAAGVRYLYTAKITEDGDFIYLVDGLPFDNSDFRNVGDPIEEECIPDMKRALANEVVLPQKIKHTTWGNIFISYFPVHDEGEVVGVLGIEFDAESQYVTFRLMGILTVIVIFLSCLIASTVAVILFKRISNPTYRDMANTDFLTGIKNRNAFEVDLHNLDTGTERDKIMLISTDLDGLKTVNDTHGHDEGDKYIQTVCRIIQKAFKDDGVLYRIGGDEIFVIAKRMDQDEIMKIFSEMADKIEKENSQSDYPLSISCGYAVFDPAFDTSLFDTMKRSDSRMYEDKKAKKE